MKESRIYESCLKSKFPNFFLRVLWTDPREIAVRYNFWVSANTKNYVAIASQNVQNTVLKMELSLHVVAPCKVRVSIRFFLLPKTNQMLKFIGECVCAIAVSAV